MHATPRSEAATGFRPWRFVERSWSARAGRALRVAAYCAPLAIAYALSIPVCPFALLGRIPCPGCGLTRAAVALVHGDVAHAQALNPLAVVVVPLAALLFVFGVATYIADGRSRMGHPWIKIAGLTAIGALWVVWGARWLGFFGGPVPI